VPLSIDNQIQERTGVVGSAGSVSVTLDTGTTAGNTLVLAITGGLSFPVPAGWVSGPGCSTFSSGPVGSETYVRLLYRGAAEGLAAGETSWTFTQTTSTSTSWMWWVAEYSNLAAIPIVSGLVANQADDFSTVNLPGVGTEVAAATLPNVLTTYLDTVSVGFSAYRGAVQTAATIADVRMSAASNRPTLALDTVAQLQTAAGSAPNFAMGLFRGFSGNAVANSTYAPSVRVEIPSGGGFDVNDYLTSVVAMLASADSPILDPIVLGTGFEYGTHHGISGGVAGSKMADVVAGTHGTNYLIQTGSTKAGTGSYGLRIVQAASIARVGWDTNTLGTGLTQAVCGWNVRPVSATTNPCVLNEINVASGTTVQVVYNTTTSKIGVRFGSGGTVAYQSGTTTINTDYPWIDLLVSGMGTTGRAVSWQIEQSGVMVAQTAPTALTGQATTTWASFTCGSATSQTMTADYDNVCLSNALVDYPLRRHKVVLVGVDTTAGADVLGTTTNLITANAAGTALSAGTGQTAVTNTLDEVPPDFSATADGFCFNAASPTGASVVVPMATYTANTTTERIDAVRACIPMWKASTTASVIGIVGNNGTNTTLAASTYNPGGSNVTTGSATAPAWLFANWPDSNGWTQTKLDAAKLTFTSTDGSPAIGPHAIYLEVAVNTDYALTPTPSPPVAPIIAGPGVLETVERSQPGYF
jgi:hypothetical protein